MAVTMNTFWDDSGTIIPGGDAEYVVAEQPIAEYDNWFNYNIVADIQAVIDDVINKFNANTILKADTDNTPAALVVAEQTIVGRKTGNSIAALTDSEVLAIIGVEPGATADQTNNEIRDAVEVATNSNTFTDADHTKLNGIEALATTDQTNAEIRTAVEAATDSNVFTDNDHTKLNGIETGADVTSIEPAYGSALFNGTAPTTWTDLDLSAAVGSSRVFAMLKVRNLNGGTDTHVVTFREKGLSDEVYHGLDSGYGYSQGFVNTEVGHRDSLFLCITNSSGIVEWRCQAAISMQIHVVGWIG